MPEPRYREMCDALQDACPDIGRSKAKRVVSAYLAQRRDGEDELSGDELRGWFLMHLDPTGSEACGMPDNGHQPNRRRRVRWTS